MKHNLSWGLINLNVYLLWCHNCFIIVFHSCNTIQLITLCEVNSRKCGPEDYDSSWPAWPRPMAEVRLGHRESHVEVPHFLSLTTHRVINCFIITLFSYCCKFIVKPSNTNFIVYFDRINVIGYRRETGHTTIEHGLNPWSSTFKASKLWMFVLLCIFFLN
jgi:hypothetical protein